MLCVWENMLWVLVGYVGLYENGMGHVSGHYKHICKRVGEGEVMLRAAGKKTKRITHRHMCVCFAYVWERINESGEQKTHCKRHTKQHDDGVHLWSGEGEQTRPWEPPTSLIRGVHKWCPGRGGKQRHGRGQKNSQRVENCM